jgi:hypothetical protein
VVVVAVLAVVVVDVVDLAQDAKTRDVTMRQVNIIHVAPLFIYTPLYFITKNLGKIENHPQRILEYINICR